MELSALRCVKSSDSTLDNFSIQIIYGTAFILRHKLLTNYRIYSIIVLVNLDCCFLEFCVCV